MPSFEHAKIYRGGVTAPHLNYETSYCSYATNTRDECIDIRFSIASKGGGTTQLLVQIGLGDLSAFLKSIANEFPENVTTFSDCAAIANAKNLENLTAARKVHDDEKARAKSLIDELEPVAEFVSEKYMEKPAGEDEREENVRNQINQVIRTLRSLK